MKIAGLDVSMNSPGKCIMTLDDNTFDILNIQFYGYHMTLVRSLLEDNVKIVSVGNKWAAQNMCERINKSIEILDDGMEEVKCIALEGYSYGSEGKVFETGEFTGCLKQHFYNKGISLISYPPNAIKAFATDSGGADKTKMRVFFKARYPQHYPLCIDVLPQDESPACDLIDAFWIAMTLRFHIMYERGIELPADIVDSLEYKSSKKSKSISETKVIKKPKN